MFTLRYLYRISDVPARLPSRYPVPVALGLTSAVCMIFRRIEVTGVFARIAILRPLGGLSIRLHLGQLGSAMVQPRHSPTSRAASLTSHRRRLVAAAAEPSERELLAGWIERERRRQTPPRAGQVPTGRHCGHVASCSTEYLQCSLLQNYKLNSYLT